MKRTLIVDCGATKTDWLASDGTFVQTAGFNLAHTPEKTLLEILDSAAQQLGGDFGAVYFYAAGLVGDSPVDLCRWFPGAQVEYASDMLGAARAVCGREAGIAAIVGTGANTCQWDGEKMVRQVRSGGFILGDEGSASVLGKLFVGDFIKNLVPESMAQAFSQQYQSDYATLVHQVYLAQAPARFLGGLAPFILSFYDKEEYAKNLVDNNFRRFFHRNVCTYDPLPLGVVGGFGHACRSILMRIGQEEFDIPFIAILPSPLEGLLKYHGV